MRLDFGLLKSASRFCRICLYQFKASLPELACLALSGNSHPRIGNSSPAARHRASNAELLAAPRSPTIGTLNSPVLKAVSRAWRSTSGKAGSLHPGREACSAGGTGTGWLSGNALSPKKRSVGVGAPNRRKGSSCPAGNFGSGMELSKTETPELETEPRPEKIRTANSRRTRPALQPPRSPTKNLDESFPNRVAPNCQKARVPNRNAGSES